MANMELSDYYSNRISKSFGGKSRYSNRFSERVKQAYSDEEKEASYADSMKQKQLNDIQSGLYDFLAAVGLYDPYAGYPDIGQSLLSDKEALQQSLQQEPENKYNSGLGKGGTAEGMMNKSNDWFGDGFIGRVRDFTPEVYGDLYSGKESNTTTNSGIGQGGTWDGMNNPFSGFFSNTNNNNSSNSNAQSSASKGPDNGYGNTSGLGMGGTAAGFGNEFGGFFGGYGAGFEGI